jgi:hypothetical protein
MSADPIVDRKLSLRPECLSSAAATRFDLAIIEAAMLYPGTDKVDTASRMRAMRSAAVALMRDAGGALNLTVDPGLFAFAADSMPLELIQEESKKPFVHGVICGFVLAETLGKIQLKFDNATIGSSIRAAEKTFWPHWRVNEKTINNYIWPKFKPVAHLWASFWMRRKAEEDMCFPCHFESISQFLSEAEGFRVMGETMRPARSKSSILDAAKMIRLPFDLSPARLEFERLNDTLDG